ncbi:MAG: N-acetyl-alpha-D-glucosaminyl L-malate synthase BshA [Alicyclobacillus sp. RIFOXYA1_FULL_53_8]|nr:MAG: N-acetyl-alpha-D-glucosaminyl L-malate synthase BshA [Alicyclobacillus sp. RIFOXYA1_FULL_53_8]
MRIGISCYPTVGGSGAVATELGKALAHKGHQVHFIVTDVPFRLGEFHQNIYIHELETTTYPVLRTPPYDFSLAALMADIVARYDLEILHVHYALPFAVSAFLAKQMLDDHPVRIVTTLHGTDVTVLAQDKTLFNVIKLGIEKSDAITAVSTDLAEQTKDLFQTHRSIESIYNFIDTDVFRPIHDSPLRGCFAQTEEKILLHISNFRKVKRITDLIDVFARIQERVSCKLLLVGEGPELASARERIRLLNLADKVRFLGNQDEVASLFAAADLFLLPSEKESFGLVALEAMACGVPVIATRAGGIPEVVVDGETGYLSNVGDTEKMAADAVTLLKDAQLHRQFSQAARDRAETVFSVHDKIREYEDLYQRVIQESWI